MITKKYNLKYNTDNIEKCEYKEMRIKSCCKAPEIIDGKCYGFRNKYTGVVSNICGKCSNFIDRK